MYFTGFFCFLFFVFNNYTGQGVIINSSYIITYNNNDYSFEPRTATYILAKDNKNNKFSILAKYDNNVLTSISVLIDQVETYELQSGGTVS